MTSVKRLLPVFLALTGCGVSMEDVKLEILPAVENNKREIDELRKTHEDSLKDLSVSVDELEVAASTLRDKINDLRATMMKTLEEQNAHLAEVDRLQLEILEKTSRHLEQRLKGTRELIERLRGKQSRNKAPAETP